MYPRLFACIAAAAAVPCLLHGMAGAPKVPGPVAITLSVAGALTANGADVFFSPNFDGSQDAVTVRASVPSGIFVQDWELVIMNEHRNVVRIITRKDVPGRPTDFFEFLSNVTAPRQSVPVPSEMEWDGTSQLGWLLPEGWYSVFLRVFGGDGYVYVSATNRAYLDNTPPYGSFGLDDNVFSPNGDGVKDAITIYQELSPGDLWRAEIRDQEGRMFRSWDFGRSPPKTIVWDGRDNAGKTCPEGTYDYVALGRDDAGNIAALPVNNLHLSLKKYYALLNSDRKSFSPGGGMYGKVRITPALSDSKGVARWRLAVKDRAGAVVKSVDGRSVPPPYEWDGRNDRGEAVPDGYYYFQLAVDYDNGEKAQSDPYRVMADRSPPVVGFRCKPEVFSPDGDGIADTCFMEIRADDPSGVRQWELMIWDPDNRPFRKFRGNGLPPVEVIRWNGRSDTGELVESARDYRVSFYSMDNLGNSATVTNLGKVKVDVLVEPFERGLRIRINNIEFDFAKADLKPAAYPILDRVCEILNKYGRYRVEVQGHTDNIDTYEKNMALSMERAAAVARYLVQKGLAEGRLTLKGFGFQYPVADNNTEEGRRKNRRVEFILIKN